MNLLPGVLKTRSLSLIIALCFLAVLAGVIAYLFIFTKPQPGEILSREITRLEEVVAQHPRDPNSRVALALLYSEAGSKRQALALLKTALEFDDSHQGALIALGDLQMELGHYKEAIEPYEKVVELNKESEMRRVSVQLEGVYYYLGSAYLKLEKYEEAIDSLQEALAIDRTDADAWYVLGAFAGIGLPRGLEVEGDYLYVVDTFGHTETAEKVLFCRLQEIRLPHA